MRFLVSLALAATACAPAATVAKTTPPPAAPSPPPVARTVDLELIDTNASGSKTRHYLLSVVDDQGWSRISERTPNDGLDLRASSSLDRHGFPAIVRVELHRDAQGAPDVFITQSTIFFAGRRTVLGHVDGAAGSTEIAMVTR